MVAKNGGIAVKQEIVVLRNCQQIYSSFKRDVISVLIG